MEILCESDDDVYNLFPVSSSFPIKAASSSSLRERSRHWLLPACVSLGSSPGFNFDRNRKPQPCAELEMQPRD